MQVPSFVALGLAGVLLAACARPDVEIQSNVESYSEISGIEGASIAVVPLREGQEASLEFKAMAELLEQRLAEQGMIVTPASEDSVASEDSDYVAVFHYNIDAGSAVTETYSVPRFGFSSFYGHRWPGFHAHYAWHGPRWGVVGYSVQERRWIEYSRGASLTIIDPDASTETSPAVVYESRVASTGSCGRLQEIMPYLLDAMFADFPKSTSELEVITVPAEAFDC